MNVKWNYNNKNLSCALLEFQLASIHSRTVTLRSWFNQTIEAAVHDPTATPPWPTLGRNPPVGNHWSIERSHAIFHDMQYFVFPRSHVLTPCYLLGIH